MTNAPCIVALALALAGCGARTGLEDVEEEEEVGDLHLPIVPAVDTGDSHTCVVTEVGEVYCWGWGLHGQLGYGDTEDIGDDELPSAAGPVDVGGVVVQIAVGNLHTCALLEDGAIRCWGANQAGQLGTGTTEFVGDDELPSSIDPVDVGGRAVQVEAGAFSTCAVLEDRTVRCWGGPGDDPPPPHPVDLAGSAAQLSAALSSTCVLLEDGSVQCWGASWNGQLGYGEQYPMDFGGWGLDPPLDVLVDVGGRAVGLASGSEHHCALLDEGLVRCWGRNNDCQLGLGPMHVHDVGDDEVPSSLPPVDVGGRVVQVAGGYSHTCALIEDGTIRCWGEGFLGATGAPGWNDVGDDEPPSAVGPVNLGGVAIQITAGSTHTCALMATGAVRCWGSQCCGELGYGNLEVIGDDENPADAGDVQFR